MKVCIHGVSVAYTSKESWLFRGSWIVDGGKPIGVHGLWETDHQTGCLYINPPEEDDNDDE